MINSSNDEIVAIAHIIKDEVKSPIVVYKKGKKNKISPVSLFK